MGGHTTMWKQADGDGVMSIHVKTCDPSEVVNGACPEDGAAYLRDIYGLNGCNNGANCEYHLISDIWNGLSGDDGYAACAGGQPHYSSGCSTSITNIRFKAKSGAFGGKCAPLAGSPAPPFPPSPTRRRSAPSPSSWVPCSQSSAHCCNPTYTDPVQICPNGQACQSCGGSDACECPGQSVVI